MKRAGIALLATVFLVGLSALSQASVVDVIQSPTGYFVPSDAMKLYAPYYRWFDEDWGWQHNPIALDPVTSAELYISAYDIDSAYGQVDDVYVKDEGVWVNLGSMTGVNNQWSYRTYSLGSQFFNEVQSGLEVWFDIDVENNRDTWAVTLAKSVLTVNGGTPPDPRPLGIPEPATLLVWSGLGGLGAVMAWRRKRQAA